MLFATSALTWAGLKTFSGNGYDVIVGNSLNDADDKEGNILIEGVSFKPNGPSSCLYLPDNLHRNKDEAVYTSVNVLVQEVVACGLFTSLDSEERYEDCYISISNKFLSMMLKHSKVRIYPSKGKLIKLTSGTHAAELEYIKGQVKKNS